MFTSNNIARKGRVAFALACTLALPGILTVSAQAQTTKTHHSWFHRHPTATTAGAGVGAGTGATTAPLLRHFPPNRTKYTFTDISAEFLQKARALFSDYSFVEYSIFDLDHLQVQSATKI